MYATFKLMLSFKGLALKLNSLLKFTRNSLSQKYILIGL